MKPLKSILPALLLAGMSHAWEFQDSSAQFLPLGFYHESHGEPQFDTLLGEFDYDEAAKTGATEFQRQCLIMNWQYYLIPFNTPPSDCVRQALCTLRGAMEGQTFHCVNMSATFMQCALSLGWSVRTIALPSHTTTEIWSNQFHKWVYMEVTWNIHVEDTNGVPLSLAEARAEYARNNAEDIVYVFGVGKDEDKFTYKDMPYDRTDPKSVYDSSRKIYRDFLMFLCRPFFVGRNNYLTSTNHFYPGYCIVDDIDQHMTDWVAVWLERGGGKKFDEENMEQLYFDLNRTDIAIEKKADTVFTVSLDAFGYNNYTPNFKEFQIRKNNGSWQKADQKSDYTVSARPDTLEARTVNAWGVYGPVSSITISNADTRAPSIGGIALSMLNDSSVKITWQTDEYARCTLSYGKSSANDRTIVVNPVGTSHETKLPDLDPNSLYRYRISATDLFGNSSNGAEYTYATVQISQKSDDLEKGLSQDWTSTMQRTSGTTRNGAYSLEAAAGSEATWKLSDENTYGRVTMYVFDSGNETDSTDKGYPAIGPHWGIMNKEGDWIGMGINRCARDNWNGSYGLTESDDLKWTYPLFTRKTGWNKWVFDVSREGTCNITLNDSMKSVIYNFRWPWDKVTQGFNRVFFKGDSFGGPEKFYFDDISVAIMKYNTTSSVGRIDQDGKGTRYTIPVAITKSRYALLFHVTLPKREHVTVALFALNGSRIRSICDRTINAGTHAIQVPVSSLKGLAQGAYLIQVTTSAGRVVMSCFSLQY